MRVFRAQTKQAAPEPWRQHVVPILHRCLLAPKGLTSPPAASDSHVSSNPPSPSHCRHLIPCCCINHLHGHRYTKHRTSASLVALMVKNLPAVQATWVQSLGWEDPLEKGMATHSSILTWRSPWTEETGGYSPWGCKGLDVTERLTVSPFTLYLSQAESQETKQKAHESP